MALVSEFCCILGMGIAFWGWGRSRIRMDSNAGRLMGFSLIFRQFEVRSLESATAAILMMVKESFTIIMTSFHHFTIIAVAHLLLSSSSQLSHFPPENKWFFLKTGDFDSKRICVAIAPHIRVNLAWISKVSVNICYSFQIGHNHNRRDFGSLQSSDVLG